MYRRIRVSNLVKNPQKICGAILNNVKNRPVLPSGAGDFYGSGQGEGDEREGAVGEGAALAADRVEARVGFGADGAWPDVGDSGAAELEGDCRGKVDVGLGGVGVIGL